MHSKMATDKAKSHGLSATALLEETLQSITYFLTYLFTYLFVVLTVCFKLHCSLASY